MKYDPTSKCIEIEVLFRSESGEYNPKEMTFSTNEIRAVTPINDGNAQEVGAKSQIITGFGSIWVSSNYEELKKFFHFIKRSEIEKSNESLNVIKDLKSFCEVSSKEADDMKSTLKKILENTEKK